MFASKHADFSAVHNTPDATAVCHQAHMSGAAGDCLDEFNLLLHLMSCSVVGR
jgi:hypothetical protein